MTDKTAIEVLMLVSRGGPTMLARIGVMRALQPSCRVVLNPERNVTRWGSGS